MIEIENMDINDTAGNEEEVEFERTSSSVRAETEEKEKVRDSELFSKQKVTPVEEDSEAKEIPKKGRSKILTKQMTPDNPYTGYHPKNPYLEEEQ